MADIGDEPLLVDHPHARLSVRGMGDQHGCGTETKRHVSDVAAACALDSSVEARPAKLTGLRRGLLEEGVDLRVGVLECTRSDGALQVRLDGGCHGVIDVRPVIGDR